MREICYLFAEFASKFFRSSVKKALDYCEVA